MFLFCCQDQNTQLRAVVIAVTTEGHLLIFSRKKLVKNCSLPFKDCNAILTYSFQQFPFNKEFVIVIAEGGSAAIIDLQNFLVGYRFSDTYNIVFFY